jgi:hypothetical protein
MITQIDMEAAIAIDMPNSRTTSIRRAHKGAFGPVVHEHRRHEDRI